MLICQDFFSLSDHFSAINIGQQTRSAPNIWIFGCRHTKKSSTSATSLSTKRAIVNHLKWLLVHCQTTHQSFPHQCIVSFSRLVLITHIHTNHIQKQRCHQASNQRLGFVYRQLVTTSEATRPKCYTLDIDNSSSNINSRIHSEEYKEKCHNKIHNDEPCNTSLIAFTTHHTA